MSQNIATVTWGKPLPLKGTSCWLPLTSLWQKGITPNQGPLSFCKTKRNRSCSLKTLCFIFQEHKRKPQFCCVYPQNGLADSRDGQSGSGKEETNWSMTQTGPSEPTWRNNLVFSLPLPLPIYTPLLMDSHFNQQEDAHIKMAPTLKEQTQRLV